MPAMKPFEGASEGHELLREWMRDEYGASARTSRPSWSAIKAFHAALNEHLSAGLALRSPNAVYDWFPEAQNLAWPSDPFRLAIAEMSGGKVPLMAWMRPLPSEAA